jgi:hypothetical protein
MAALSQGLGVLRRRVRSWAGGVVGDELGELARGLRLAAYRTPAHPRALRPRRLVGVAVPHLRCALWCGAGDGRVDTHRSRLVNVVQRGLLPVRAFRVGRVLGEGDVVEGLRC